MSNGSLRSKSQNNVKKCQILTKYDFFVKHFAFVQYVYLHIDILLSFK